MKQWQEQKISMPAWGGHEKENRGIEKHYSWHYLSTLTLHENDCCFALCKRLHRSPQTEHPNSQKRCSVRA
eukprot:82242-Pelagomonas_calceolata.AAC.5